MHRLAREARRLDYFRRSPAAMGGPGGHKEWHHFCILGPNVDLLVNFSFSDDTRPAAEPGAELARLTVLARDADGSWTATWKPFQRRQFGPWVVMCRPRWGRIRSS
jgi:hypothetical protein